MLEFRRVLLDAVRFVKFCCVNPVMPPVLLSIVEVVVVFVVVTVVFTYVVLLPLNCGFSPSEEERLFCKVYQFARNAPEPQLTQMGCARLLSKKHCVQPGAIIRQEEQMPVWSR